MADGEYVVGLRRLGDNVKKHRLINLNEKDEVTIGRSPDVTVCLLSNMISRCHTVLKRKDGNSWTIKDNKSLNGVYINGKKLESQTSHTLLEGDVIQLGVPKSAEEPAEFVFQFHNKIKAKRSRPKSLDEPDCSQKKLTMKRIRLDENNCKNQSAITNGTTITCDSGDDKPSTSGAKTSQFLEYKRKIDLQEEEAVSKFKELEERLAEMQKKLQEKEKDQDEMKKRLQEEQEKRENQTNEMSEKLKQKEIELQNQTVEMKERLKEKENELEKELKRKKAEEERLKEELENQLLNREAELMEQLQCQKDRLISEKVKVEESLQEAMAKALEEKDRKLEEELIQEKEKLQRIIEQKESEQKMLASQLQETKDEKDKQKEAVLHAREDILSNFADLMEMELQCTICSELFIQATSLACSHSYCAYCIAQWMKVKRECPVCRAPITTHMRSIALDSYINTMVDHLSEEMKERRKTLIEARKKEQEELDKANKPEPPTTTANVRGGRGRGRGGRGRRRGRQNNTAAPPTPARRPIIIDSDPSDDNDVVVAEEVEVGNDSSEENSGSDSDAHYYSQNSSDDDSDYVHGEPGAYYGGYGSCFICGSRGHWANGCPFR